MLPYRLGEDSGMNRRDVRNGRKTWVTVLMRTSSIERRKVSRVRKKYPDVKVIHASEWYRLCVHARFGLNPEHTARNMYHIYHGADMEYTTEYEGYNRLQVMNDKEVSEKHAAGY